MKHTLDVTGTPVTASYVWDVNRSVPEILQDGTTTSAHGLGRTSATDGSGNQTYYTGDGLGSTTDLTNGSATKTDGYSYDAFGTEPSREKWRLLRKCCVRDRAKSEPK